MTGTPTFDGTGAVASAADAEVYELGDTMLQLLLDASHTGGAVSAHRCRLPNGTVGANPHQHLTATELFYVLSGGADLLAGTRLVRAREGDLVVVPPTSPHTLAAAPKAGHPQIAWSAREPRTESAVANRSWRRQVALAFTF